MAYGKKDSNVADEVQLEPTSQVYEQQQQHSKYLNTVPKV